MDNRIVGIDVGGTFTDFILLDEGHFSTYKIPSTPDDPSRAVIDGLRELGALDSVPIVHGSTVATNALLERRGARTALITTQGFEDILEIGRQARPSLYDLLQDKPLPLVDRQLCFGAPERTDHKGAVVLALEDEEARAIIRQIQEAKVDAVAVSLLFSFLNPVHEETIREMLDSLPSQPFVSISSDVLPEFREYERTTTVTINAYVGPVTSRYMKQLEKQLNGQNLRVMQSSGGSISAAQASEQPVRTILSGPAGGVVGAFWIASQAGHDQIITLDMGGTSTDVSLCPGYIQETTTSVTGGFPVSVPMIDIQTVGAGGGSIASIDTGRALQVGPRSAGANPGPACYGNGLEVTVTDANLLLGRLVPTHFLGGRMPLHVQRAQHVISQLASELETDNETAALGVIRVVNSNMERAIRAVSLERGFDPREFTLVAFGGAGAMHACELAEELRLPRVLIPQHPGILSALGVATANVVKDYSRTVMLKGNALNTVAVNQAFQPLEKHAVEELAKEGFGEEDLVLQRLLDLRYVGQSYELTVECPLARGSEFHNAVAATFHQSHQRRFGYSDTSQKVEVINLRLKALGHVNKPAIARGTKAKSIEVFPIASREALFTQGLFRETPIYDRETLVPGVRVTGPAIIAQMDATTVLPPGWKANVDDWRNLIAEQV